MIEMIKSKILKSKVILKGDRLMTKELIESTAIKMCPNELHLPTYVQGFVDGAKFANEWHKVSDKLPEMDVLVYLWTRVGSFPMIACRHKECGQIDWYWDCNQGEYYISRLVSIDDGYLWKEIVLPKGCK